MKKEEYIERVKSIRAALSLASKMNANLSRDLKKELDNNFGLLDAWANVSTTQTRLEAIISYTEEALTQYKDDRTDL